MVQLGNFQRTRPDQIALRSARFQHAKRSRIPRARPDDEQWLAPSDFKTPMSLCLITVVYR